MNKKIAVGFLTVSLLLQGCGGGEKDEDEGRDVGWKFSTDIAGDGFYNGTANAPAVAVERLRVLDVLSRPIAGIEVGVAYLSDLTSLDDVVVDAVTNSEGYADLTLWGGTYMLVLSLEDTIVGYQKIHVFEENTLRAADISVPLSCDMETCSYKEAIISSLSGVFLVNGEPVEGVQVSINGGDLTNGSISVDVTDKDGQYDLPINISSKYEYDIQEVSRLAAFYDGEWNYFSFPVDTVSYIGVNLEGG